MIRGFFSGASGLKSQQQKLNVVANNIANVGTTGYKAQSQQFSTLVYRNVNGALPPISTGHGVRPVDIATDFAQGQPNRTDNLTDFYISGDAFFAVEDDATGEIYYTRNGNFQYQVLEDEEAKYLITPLGQYVLDSEGERINITERMDEVEEGQIFSLKDQIGLYQFANNFGLEHVGDNLFKETEVSGEATAFVAEDIDYDPEDGGAAPEVPEIIEGYLENSNTNLADEMVKMIESNRAFQFNSRVVSVADELAQTMNQMR